MRGCSSIQYRNIRFPSEFIHAWRGSNRPLETVRGGVVWGCRTVGAMDGAIEPPRVRALCLRRTASQAPERTAARGWAGPRSGVYGVSCHPTPPRHPTECRSCSCCCCCCCCCSQGCRPAAGTTAGAGPSPAEHPSPQLAVLAAPAVVATLRLFLFVVRLLTVHAQPYARHCLTPRQGNWRVAFLTVFQTRALAQLAPRAGNRIVDGGVDLVLDRAISGPTGSHGQPPQVCRLIWGQYTHGNGICVRSASAT